MWAARVKGQKFTPPRAARKNNDKEVVTLGRYCIPSVNQTFPNHKSTRNKNVNMTIKNCIIFLTNPAKLDRDIFSLKLQNVFKI